MNIITLKVSLLTFVVELFALRDVRELAVGVSKKSAEGKWRIGCKCDECAPLLKHNYLVILGSVIFLATVAEGAMSILCSNSARIVHSIAAFISLSCSFITLRSSGLNTDLQRE